VGRTEGDLYFSDLNDLYKYLINRNTRLRHQINQQGPDPLVRNEQRLLQGAVANLFDNGNLAKPVLGGSGGQLQSLVDDLTQAVLYLVQKPVDYSARLVALPDPNRTQGTVGVPDSVFHELLESLPRRPVLIVADEEKVLTLRPESVAGEALRLHPQDAVRLGVTFAGTQVTVHVPLSREAIQELSAPRGSLKDECTLSIITREDVIDWASAAEEVELPLHPLDRIALGGRGLR
jgi:DNA-directed RNA polymerase beta' subunit